MFNTYPEDFFLLQRQIKMRKIDEYLMDIAIVANPHREGDDAKEFVENLMSERRWYRGDEDAEAELDTAAFEQFRNTMQNESKSIKAK